MAIKCANCKGKHDTIKEVQLCHGTAKEQRMATPRQVSFMDFLLENREVTEDEKDRWSAGLTMAEASAAIDVLQKRPRLNKDWMVKPQDPTIIGTVPKHGTYTVVKGDGDYRTLRIKKVHPRSDRVVVEYLFGPQNSTDFRRFGDVVEGGVYVHNGYKKEGDLLNALTFLLTADKAQLEKAGYTYALASGNCYICGRKLTVPASIHRGMGPVCASKEA